MAVAFRMWALQRGEAGWWRENLNGGSCARAMAASCLLKRMAAGVEVVLIAVVV
jgi:hypothetical protein